jgi:hypothetical protein
LPVGYAVGGLDVDETSFGGEVVVVDLFCDGLAAEPVAVVVGLKGMSDSEPSCYRCILTSPAYSITVTFFLSRLRMSDMVLTCRASSPVLPNADPTVPELSE